MAKVTYRSTTDFDKEIQLITHPHRWDVHVFCDDFVKFWDFVQCPVAKLTLYVLNYFEEIWKHIWMFYHFSVLRSCRLLEFFLKDEDSFVPLSRYHGCWWPGDARSQVINSQGIDLVLFKYFSLSSRRINIFCTFMTVISFSNPATRYHHAHFFLTTFVLIFKSFIIGLLDTLWYLMARLACQNIEFLCSCDVEVLCSWRDPWLGSSVSPFTCWSLLVVCDEQNIFFLSENRFFFYKFIRSVTICDWLHDCFIQHSFGMSILWWNMIRLFWKQSWDFASFQYFSVIWVSRSPGQLQISLIETITNQGSWRVSIQMETHP